MSKFLKQPLVLILLLSAFAQPTLANDAPAADSASTTAPAQTPVQLAWDRVGDRERGWA